jgi:hypothetical protein
MKLRIIALTAIAFALSACGSLPVSAAYTTTIAGHKVAASYNKTDGFVVAAEKLPAHPSK